MFTTCWSKAKTVARAPRPILGESNNGADKGSTVEAWPRLQLNIAVGKFQWTNWIRLQVGASSGAVPSSDCFVHQRIPWRIGNRTLSYSDLRQFTFYLTSNFNVSRGVLSDICSFFVGIISGIQFLSSIVFNKYVTYSSGQIFWHVISGSIWYKFW